MSLENNDYETFWVPDDGYTIKPLHSVGCVIISQAGPKSPESLGITYPMFVDGSWDESNGTHLEDTCDEWFERLDTDDSTLVNEVKLELGMI